MSVIDDYLEQTEQSKRAELERIRAIAMTLLPGCEETISYGMPTIRYQGKPIIGFATRKNHIGIYPFSSYVISKVEELKNYATTKGAIQERLDHPLPHALLQKIIRERVKQADVKRQS
jgi:uncharacterized protein YdhG (YjbR/CyaY superfamily)